MVTGGTGGSQNPVGRTCVRPNRVFDNGLNLKLLFSEEHSNTRTLRSAGLSAPRGVNRMGFYEPAAHFLPSRIILPADRASFVLDFSRAPLSLRSSRVHSGSDEKSLTRVSFEGSARRPYLDFPHPSDRDWEASREEKKYPRTEWNRIHSLESLIPIQERAFSVRPARTLTFQIKINSGESSRLDSPGNVHVCDARTWHVRILSSICMDRSLTDV